MVDVQVVEVFTVKCDVFLRCFTVYCKCVVFPRCLLCYVQLTAGVDVEVVEVDVVVFQHVLPQLGPLDVGLRARRTLVRPLPCKCGHLLS